jgi:hypothetical protein
LPTRRIIGLAVATLAFGLVIASANVPVTSLSPTGFAVTYYSFSGTSTATQIPSFPGYTTSLVRTGGNLTATTLYDYSLEGAQTVNATVAVEPTVSRGLVVALGNRTTFTNVFPESLPGRQTAIGYTWSDNGANYTGTVMLAPLTYIKGGGSLSSVVVFFFSAQVGRSGTDLALAVANYTSTIFPSSPSANFATSSIVGPILSNFVYFELAMAFAFFGTVSFIARDEDLVSTRLFDNSLPLGPREQKVLAAAASGRGAGTGSDLLRLGQDERWSQLRPMLDKLGSQGVLGLSGCSGSRYDNQGTSVPALRLSSLAPTPGRDGFLRP